MGTAAAHGGGATDKSDRTAAGSHKIGVLGMVVVGFFWVHGGIYGNEAMLMAGPPSHVFSMLTLAPFVYSLPIALIVAELSTAFPEDGGYVVWVTQACGDAIGRHHAYWVWVIYAVDAAIYPVLVTDYVATVVKLGPIAKSLLPIAIILAVSCINLLGTDVMVKFNTLLAVVSLAPTLVFIAIGLPEIRPSVCMRSAGDPDWSLLVSWILWLYCGFFSLGTLAGELESPRRTFTISIAVLLPAVLLLNTLPLAVAISLDPDPTHYTAGYFNVLASRLAGRWLDIAFQLGANVCLIGLYNAAAMTAERSMAFLCSSLYHDAIACRVSVLKRSPTRAAKIARYLLEADVAAIPPVFIIANACICCLLVWVPYIYLVEFSMLLSVPSILLFMWSFVALRVQRPDVKRPFLIPGGLSAAILITAIPVAISVAYAAIVATESVLSPASGLRSARMAEGHISPIYQIYSMIAVLGAGVACHVGSRLIADPDESKHLRAASHARPLPNRVPPPLATPPPRGAYAHAEPSEEAGLLLSPREKRRYAETSCHAPHAEPRAVAVKWGGVLAHFFEPGLGGSALPSDGLSPLGLGQHAGTFEFASLDDADAAARRSRSGVAAVPPTRRRSLLLENGGSRSPDLEEQLETLETENAAIIRSQHEDALMSFLYEGRARPSSSFVLAPCMMGGAGKTSADAADTDDDDDDDDDDDALSRATGPISLQVNWVASSMLSASPPSEPTHDDARDAAEAAELAGSTELDVGPILTRIGCSA